MLLGVSAIFFMMFSNIFSYNFVNGRYEIKNSINVAKLFSVFVMLFTVSYYQGKYHFDLSNYEFLRNYLFYILLISGFVYQITERRFMKYNEKNLAISNFNLFAGMAITPVASELMNKYFDFQEYTINVHYKDFSETLLYSGMLLFLTFIIFYNKIKAKQINKPIYLFVLLFISTFSHILFIKFLQKYNILVVYSISIIFNGTIYFILALKNKENEFLKRTDLRNVFILSLFQVLYVACNMFAIKHLTSEHISLFRTLFTFIIALSFDYFNNERKFTLDKKDIFVIAIIIMIAFLWKY